jgi:TPR repeat protein
MNDHSTTILDGVTQAMYAKLCRAHQQGYFIVVLFLGILIINGCAGPNPNIGERTADRAYLRHDFEKQMEIIKRHAEKGEPWAQLRLGNVFHNGHGVGKDLVKAVKWYKRAAVQKAEGDWAEGLMVGAFGKGGFFNQNSDARIAQAWLADAYLNGGEGVPKDLFEAYFNIRTVAEET